MGLRHINIMRVYDGEGTRMEVKKEQIQKELRRKDENTMKLKKKIVQRSKGFMHYQKNMSKKFKKYILIETMLICMNYMILTLCQTKNLKKLNQM